MKLATTTGDFDAFSISYLEKVKMVNKAGFKNIDLSLYTVSENDTLLISSDWRETADALLEYAKAEGISFVQCHSPNTNPLDKNQVERAVALNIRAIEVCGALGIPNMVVHSGWDFSISKEEWFKRNKEFFCRILPTAEKYNVNVLHENSTRANMHGFYPFTGAEMREFSEYVNHPNFHSCWDTGHANIEGNQYDELLALGDDLYAVHINDNRGTKDEHLIPFFGTVNMDDVMHGLIDIGFKGPFTFESGSSIRPSDYWLGHRHAYKEDNRLQNAPLFLHEELERYMFSVGKHILTSYNLFEE